MNKISLFFTVFFLISVVIFLAMSFAQATLVIAEWSSDAREGAAFLMVFLGALVGALFAAEEW